MDRTEEIKRFQLRFRTWLGSNPDRGAQIVAQRSGYSLEYVRWAAGLRGQTTWPGSRRFMRRMERLGCSERPWRERSAAEIRQAFEQREALSQGQMN